MSWLNDIEFIEQMNEPLYDPVDYVAQFKQRYERFQELESGIDAGPPKPQPYPVVELPNHTISLSEINKPVDYPTYYDHLNDPTSNRDEGFLKPFNPLKCPPHATAVGCSAGGSGSVRGVSSRCDHCELQLNCEGKCGNPACPNYGEIVDREKYEESEREARETQEYFEKRADGRLREEFLDMCSDL